MKVINNVGLYQAVYQITSTIESTVWKIKVLKLLLTFFGRHDPVNEASYLTVALIEYIRST